MASDDRTVHAQDRYVEVVRYDRAGHWYIEPFSGKRVQVTVEAAARRATVWSEVGRLDRAWLAGRERVRFCGEALAGGVLD